MKDLYKDMRKKVRYVIELRYPPLINIFDKRGEILNEIHPKFKSNLEHWKVDTSQVIMADSFEENTKQITIGHLRSSFVYEDPSTYQEVYNDFVKFLSEIKRVFPELNNLKRFGFRCISLIQNDSIKSFEDISNKIKSVYFKEPFPSKLTPKDLKITLSSDEYNIGIGPIKGDEGWVRTIFANLSKNIPKYGLGLDIDTFVKDVDCSSKNELSKIFTILVNLKTSIENDVLSNFN